jgi:hypothetical protein
MGITRSAKKKCQLLSIGVPAFTRPISVFAGLVNDLGADRLRRDSKL